MDRQGSVCVAMIDDKFFICPDWVAFIFQAQLGVEEGSLPAVQMGGLVRQSHLLQPGLLRRLQKGPVVT